MVSLRRVLSHLSNGFFPFLVHAFQFLKLALIPEVFLEICQIVNGCMKVGFGSSKRCSTQKAHYAFAGKPYITKTQSKHCPRTCSLKPLAHSRKVPFLFYLKLLFLKSVQLILQNQVHFFFVGGCIVTILNCSMILQLPGVGLLKTSSFFPHTTRS